MRKTLLLVLLVSVILLTVSIKDVPEVLRVSVSSLNTDKVVNMHESVEDDGDIAKLRATMEDVGVNHVVLHGIPYDLLHYHGEQLIDYEQLDQNHAFIEEVAKNDPEHFSFFCAVDPKDPNRMGKVQNCLEDGGLGIKVYTGYSYAHEMPLDDPQLLKIYDMVNELGGILMLPVKTDSYQDELENVLTLYPDLPVVCPHYCLSSKRLDRVRDLLDRYPNLYVDTSFGHIEYTVSGLQEMSDNISEFRDFFYTYQDRILLGTDTVVTGYEWKDRDWLDHLHYDYLSMMTSATYKSRTVPTLELNGLNLPTAIQRKVLWQNWNNLIP